MSMGNPDPTLTIDTVVAYYGSEAFDLDHVLRRADHCNQVVQVSADELIAYVKDQD